jgi:hypothetical protein
MKKSELEATNEALMRENAELKAKIVMYQRSIEIGDDR